MFCWCMLKSFESFVGCFEAVPASLHSFAAISLQGWKVELWQNKRFHEKAMNLWKSQNSKIIFIEVVPQHWTDLNTLVSACSGNCAVEAWVLCGLGFFLWADSWKFLQHTNLMESFSNKFSCCRGITKLLSCPWCLTQHVPFGMWSTDLHNEVEKHFVLFIKNKHKKQSLFSGARWTQSVWQ